jgi:cell division protein FtsI/penicillin-binding protein 2
MLEAVFEPGGTAARAAIAGYRLAGKTGTAQKVVDGRYSDTRFIANFVGFAPARRPVLAGMVAVDEPSAGITSGGAVAAPVFAAIVERVLPYLGVPPGEGDVPEGADEAVLAAAEAPIESLPGGLEG